jgi:hypothetical protein
MKTVEINIGEDALAEIKRAITVNRIAQGGGNHMFVSIAQRIVDAADTGESVLLMTAIDKQGIFDGLSEEKQNEDDPANTGRDLESMGSDV